MKHLSYIRLGELLKEADYTPDTEATDARKRANTSAAAQSGEKPKMSGPVRTTGGQSVVDPKKGSPHLQYRSGSSPRRAPRRR